MKILLLWFTLLFQPKTPHVVIPNTINDVNWDKYDYSFYRDSMKEIKYTFYFAPIKFKGGIINFGKKRIRWDGKSNRIYIGIKRGKQ